MIGTSVTDAFTFVHHVEETEGVDYRRFRRIKINCRYTDGKEEMKEVRLYAKKPGWTMNLARLENLFKEKRVLDEKIFNGISCSLVRLGEAYPIIRDDIHNNQARNISHFSLGLYARELAKKTLSSLHLHRTLTDRISHGPGPR